MRICPACGNIFTGSCWNCPVCKWTPPEINGFPALAPEFALEGGNFHQHYFEELAALEGNNFWFQFRNKLILYALKRYFPEIGKLLEVGCGTGYVLAGIADIFPSAKLTGTEIFSSGLTFASTRVPSAELFQMDARMIPYENYFDVVGCFDVLEHISEDKQVLGEFYKSLLPGGVLVVTVPQHPWMWSKQDELACHVRRYSGLEIQHKIIEAGFILLYQTSFVSFLLPLMWGSRYFKNNTESDDALSELRLGWLGNRLLSFVTSLEFQLLRAGFRFPFGGSSLVVARKE